MLTVQEMFDIAARHMTAMADAMVAACVVWSVETGEPLAIPRTAREARPPAIVRPAEGVDWRRMVEGNSDTRLMHA